MALSSIATLTTLTLLICVHGKSFHLHCRLSFLKVFLTEIFHLTGYIYFCVFYLCASFIRSFQTCYQRDGFLTLFVTDMQKD